MAFINFFTSATALDFLFKLLIAFVLSALIGIERELIHKPAGIKTHTLICISATLVMSLGMYMYHSFPELAVDPTRLPAQILAGIGFVGAGTILREGLSVKGITTAASLLATTCIGLAVGAGFYEGAIFSTIMIFFILCFVSPVQKAIVFKRKSNVFNIISNSEQSLLSKIQTIFEKENLDVYSTKTIHSNSSNTTIYKVWVRTENANQNEKLLQELSKIEGVIEANLSKDILKSDVD